MEPDEIAYETAAGVAEITLDRPKLLNAISARPGGMRDQLIWALDEAAKDPQVGCVLITGARKAFSGGGDVTGNARRDTPLEQAAFLEAAEVFHRRLREARLPVVAAVHGYCLGAALTLIASCDLVIAGEGARLRAARGPHRPDRRRPLVPIVGRQWAKFLIMSGEVIEADQARRIGLVLTVEPDDRLLDRARDLARPRWPDLPRDHRHGGHGGPEAGPRGPVPRPLAPPLLKGHGHVRSRRRAAGPARRQRVGPSGNVAARGSLLRRSP